MTRKQGMDNEALVASVTIQHPQGLHLRVGREVVHVANRFEATITAENLTRSSPVVDAKSILQLMQLQARQGHVLRVTVLGPDAAEAMDALMRLLDMATSL